MLTLEEARTALDQSRAEYRELIGGMSEADLSRCPPGYTWTNRQTAWHLAFLQNRIPRTAPRIRSGRGMDPPSSSGGRWASASTSTPS